MKEFKDQCDAFDKFLDEFQDHKVKFKYQNNEAEKYLNLTEDQMRKMSPEDMGIASAVLSLYAMYVQLSYNTELSRLNRANRRLNEIACSEAHNYKGSNFEERKQQATLGNDVARKFNDLIVAIQGKVDRLAFVSGKIKDISYSLEYLGKVKK